MLMKFGEDKLKQISVIVPVYNTKEEYLRKCINSLIAQTIYNEIEIIIVDDGSKEQCAKICDEYSSKYENIKVIHQENQGLSVSRNNGMKVAQGKWIMFVDSDDWVENDIGEKMLELQKEDIDIIMTSCNLCYKNEIIPINNFDGKDKIWDKNNKDKIELQVIYSPILRKARYDAKYFVTVWGKLYRRSFIEKYKLYDICNLRFKEDNIFNLHCFELANKIIYKNYCLYNYRQCKNSLINTKDFEFIDLYIEYLEKELEFIKKSNKQEIFYEAHYIKVVQSIVNIIKQYMTKNNVSYKKQREKLIEQLDKEIIKNALYNINLKHLDLCRKIFLSLIVFLLKHKWYACVISISKITNLIQKKEMY